MVSGIVFVDTLLRSFVYNFYCSHNLVFECILKWNNFEKSRYFLLCSSCNSVLLFVCVLFGIFRIPRCFGIMYTALDILLYLDSGRTWPRWLWSLPPSFNGTEAAFALILFCNNFRELCNGCPINFMMFLCEKK